MRKISVINGRRILLFIIAIVSAILLVSAVSMLIRYNDDISVRAVSEAHLRTVDAKDKVYENITEYTAKAKSLAILLADCTNETDVLDTIRTAAGKEDFKEVKNFRYFKGDVLCDETGEPYNGNDVADDYYRKSPTVAGYIGSFDEQTFREGTMTMVGFYAPVEANGFLNGVVIYYPRNKLLSFFPEGGANSDAQFSVLTIDNSINEILVGGDNLDRTSIKDTLRLQIGESAPVEEVLAYIHEGKDGVIKTKITGKDYVISVGADAEKLKDLAVVELYDVDILCAANLDFVDTIIMIIILFAIVAVAVIIYLIIKHIHREREYFNMETTDTKLQCLNRHGFEKLAKKILDRNAATNARFVIVAVHLSHYKYIEETFGESETSNLLLHIRVALTKIIGLEESFGHINNGQFVMLIHIKDKDDLLTRLKIISYLAAQYKSAQKFDIKLRYGIYEVDFNEHLNVTQMVDFANEANYSLSRAVADNANLQFNYYNSELRKIRSLNEDMELRMEGALKDGEFQLFYQPKYNLRLGKQDGCEALVRWYDPKTKKFNPPALFMQLFESNGFIIKLDKYVYTKVCEYISYSIARGNTVYPVSVNVSRITAVQPDFVDYYYKTKRKYGISDGLIMIEFTESFAYEDYETLRVIVDGLHSKGFKCSIDDFGSGYSSYRILKSLPMDEIKLDKFFLEKSDSEERDFAIFTSIIQLAKNLGMKVTQEGVEYKEDLDRLISLGCDVVQGYYYSYPLPLSDYIIFANTSREHNIT